MRGFETAWRLEGFVEGGNENEDRVGICEGADALVFVVADGAGGRAGGGVASRRAVEIVRKAITGERPNDDPQIWAERLAGIDRMLSRDKEAGETTALVVSISPVYGKSRTRRIVGASVGDSEAWRITPSGIEDLTRRQARKPLLGSGSALPVPFEAVWEEGTLLLGTDGLYKYVSQERIIEAALGTDLEQAAESLLALPRLPNGRQQDDVALLLCRCEAHQNTRQTQNASGGKPNLLKSIGNLLNWGRRDKTDPP